MEHVTKGRQPRIPESSQPALPHEVSSLILISFVCTSRTGFDHPIDGVMEDLLGTLDDPALPLLQWSDSFSSAAARLPSLLADQLEVRTCLTGLRG